MFWSRKKSGPWVPEPHPPIAFRVDDDCRQRAENIWYALGFYNDRNGTIARMAGYLAMYQEMDKGADPAPRPGLYDLHHPEISARHEKEAA